MAYNEPSSRSSENPKLPLGNKNYRWLLIGFGIVLLGMVLMAGGGSDSPDEFNYAMFSWRRITLAPILIVAGFVIEIVAIMKRFDRQKKA